ncbi:MAG: hypothetical protein MJZ37_00030 [Bacilli bacterium]|nr:hypothetical protein [Bacilli bacterium]
MTYTFKCTKCNKDFEKEISIKEYDNEKNKTYCECGGKAERTFIMDTLVTHYACDGFYDTGSKTGRYRCR